MNNEAKKYNKLVLILSIGIPLVVASLFRVKIDIELPVFLPPVYAAINACTVCVLSVAFWAVKNKKLKLHERLMKIAIILSAVFLILYVLYHMTSDSTLYGGEGTMKSLYYIILVSHIILSIVVVPFVLITFVRGLTGQLESHKKLARYTFPLWIYVAISGVLVYLMIAPYY